MPQAAAAKGWGKDRERKSEACLSFHRKLVSKPHDYAMRHNPDHEWVKVLPWHMSSIIGQQCQQDRQQQTPAAFCHLRSNHKGFWHQSCQRNLAQVLCSQSYWTCLLPKAVCPSSGWSAATCERPLAGVDWTSSAGAANSIVTDDVALFLCRYEAFRICWTPRNLFAQPADSP